MLDCDRKIYTAVSMFFANDLMSICTYRLRSRDVSVTFKFTLTGGMGSEPSLSVKQSITIDTMVNFDSDRRGHRDSTCKWAFTATFTCPVVFMQSQTLQCTMCAYLAFVTDCSISCFLFRILFVYV